MKVLIGTEGSRFSNAAIEKFCRLFDESENTKVRIVSAVQPVFMAAATAFGAVPAYSAEMDSAIRTNADKVTDQAAASIRDRIPSVGADLSTVVITGPPEQVIVEEAERWGADLVVVGSHGNGFWRRALLGSVSNAVVRNAPCSVLVVRPDVEQDHK